MYIKKCGCLVCFEHPASHHHLKTRGRSKKGSDFFGVPLCHTHHMELHNLTYAAFQRKYQVNLWYEALRLLENWHVHEMKRLQDEITKKGCSGC